MRLGQNGLLIISVCGIMVDGVQQLHQDLLDPRRSAKTSAEYARILIRLHRKLKSQHRVDQVHLWAKVPDLLPHLRQMKHTTKKTQVAVLLCALRKHPQARQKWMPAWHELCVKCERKLNGQLTSRERANWVTFAEIAAKLRELEGKVSQLKHAWSTADRRVVQAHLVLSILTSLPALRSQNMAGIRIVGKEPGDDQNVLVARDGRFALVLNSYKTAASYGRRKINFPKSLCRTMTRSLELFPRTWMVSLLRSGKHPVSTTGLSHFCAAIFHPKRFGPSLARKLWVSHMYANKPSLADKARLADAMLHSTLVASSHYHKKGLK